MTMTASFPLHRQATAARGRLMLWCGALVLLLQLFALTGHDHDNEPKAQDCVACSVQAQSHAAPPEPRSKPVLVAWMPVRTLPAWESVATLSVDAGHLRPQPHAPPVSRSLA